MEHEKEAFVEKEVKKEVPESNSTIREKEPIHETIVLCVCLLIILGLYCGAICAYSSFPSANKSTQVPYITIAFMNFTVLDTNTRLSANWDLSIRVPEKLHGSFICLPGYFQASLLYKNITIATSPIRSYNNLQGHCPQLLKVSGVVSEEDINGAIGKSIMNDIKERVEVRLGLRLFLPDSGENMTGSGTMEFACDEVKMQSDLSTRNITSTVVGSPTCLLVGH
ncbi:PREDICTED: uncharacterized protein LOC104699829 [Camelina sativa]|uniref:Uncharacterized protein LOC104699829 n=1 Tax=Camelina sativa TaxID=90675 RepID=A0ABM0SMT1_CAMSA|nr:PREDICTED: uncharacterized protein LOC104699829 [Camelina sativa]